MFGSCESIFETNVSRRNESVSATELQMMEMEITTDLAQAEADNIKTSSTMSQLDQLLNMYNHVKQYGIDRTFLSLYNGSNQLDNMLGVKFPSCESVDSEGYPNSNISRAFIVAMESSDGLLSKIWEFVKKIWDKIVNFFKTVWSKVKSWFNFCFNKAEKQVTAIRKAFISKSTAAKVFDFVKRNPELVSLAISAVYSLVRSLPCNNRSGQEHLLNKEIDDCKKLTDEVLKSKAERKASLKETTIYGDQLKKEADKCLKELENTKNMTEKLDKLEALINETDKFMSNHGVKPGDSVDALKKEVQNNDRALTNTILDWNEIAKQRSMLMSRKQAGSDPVLASKLHARAVNQITHATYVLITEVRERCKMYTTELDKLYEVSKIRDNLVTQRDEIRSGQAASTSADTGGQSSNPENTNPS